MDAMAKNTTDNPGPGGAPTKYRAAFAEQAGKLCKLGATDKEIADFFEVDESTVNRWKIAHPKFREALKSGKILADAEVADRLYQRAMGYTHPSEEIFCHEGDIVRAETTKQYAPDVAAAIFWLKNRQPEKWRDKQVIEDDRARQDEAILKAMEVVQARRADARRDG